MYYRHLGICDEQIGLLGAISPAVTFLITPLWCALADQTDAHKIIMLLTFVLSVVARYVLVFEFSNAYFLYFLVAFCAILSAPVKPLLDSAAISLLKERSDYGKSRLFGQLGFGVGSIVVGKMLGNKESIKGIFSVHVALSIPTAIMMLSFSPKKDAVKERRPSAKAKAAAAAAASNKKNIFEAVKKAALGDHRVIVFFLMVFIIGISSGIIENFAYVRIAEIGSMRSGEDHGNAVGVCRMASSLAGGPMFYLSGVIAKRIGINSILLITIASYAIRFWIYAVIDNPWNALPAEILRGSMFALFWAASTNFA